MSQLLSLRNLTLALVMSVCALKVSANQSAELELAWSKVRDGSAIAIMRHALAPGFSDPAGFDVNVCATQRNLSEEGRVQAKAIGQMFREQGINDVRLYASQWCRCVDTAELLGLGEVSVMRELNSFFENRAVTDEQTRSLRAKLNEVMQSGSQPIVLVSHQVNISALTATGTSSGDTLIITLENDEVSVLARVPAP